MLQPLVQMDETRFHIFKQNGYLRAETRKPCPKCLARYIPSCDCVILQKHLELFNEARLPAIFLAATLNALSGDNIASVSLTLAYKWIIGWAKKEPLPPQGLLLSGSNGIGKSFAMVALVRSLTLERGIPCRFVDFRQLLLDLKACYNGYGSEYELLQSLKKYTVLIIDDLGACRDTEWARDVVQSLIGLRYNTNEITFITTTLQIAGNSPSTSSLEKWIPPHSASRLAEMCYWLAVTGPDRRRSFRPHIPNREKR